MIYMAIRVRYLTLVRPASDLLITTNAKKGNRKTINKFFLCTVDYYSIMIAFVTKNTKCVYIWQIFIIFKVASFLFFGF